MAALILLLLGSWPVAYGRALVEKLHTYDIQRYDVAVVPVRDALDVDCTLRLRIERRGPVRLLIGQVEGLRADGPVEATVGTGGFERVARIVAPGVAIPNLLTLTFDPPPEPGDVVTARLRYRWHPGKGTAARVRRNRIETHLWPFWVPAMADERFDARVTLRTDMEALGVGTRTREGDRWIFEARNVQLLSLYAAPFVPTSEERFGVLLPADSDLDARALLADLAEVHRRLEEAFGAPAPGPVRLVVEPRTPPVPSFCAGSFIVIHHGVRPAGRGRRAWLNLLVHEVSHRWWGHRVGSPVVGDGGTFLREGLAQWCGARFAEDPAAVFRANVKAYLGRADIRRREGRLFANEATLENATYLDWLGVPYYRGALVCRMLEHRLGDRFREVLRELVASHGGAFARLEDFEKLCDQPALFAYYVRRSALPDFVLRGVKTGPGRASGRVECGDAAWPAGKVPVVVETEAGATTLDVDVRGGSGAFNWEGKGTPVRVEVDPERIYLDPIQKNNRWRK